MRAQKFPDNASVSVVSLILLLTACGDSDSQQNLASLRPTAERENTPEGSGLGIITDGNKKISSWYNSGTSEYRPQNFDRTFSAVVGVRTSVSGKEMACTGVLTAEDQRLYLVTAGHCFSSADPLGRLVNTAGQGTFTLTRYAPVDFDHADRGKLRLYAAAGEDTYIYRPNLSSSGANGIFHGVKPGYTYHYGNGDAIKILLKDNPSIRELANTVKVCSSDGKKVGDVVRGVAGQQQDVIDQLVIAQTKNTSIFSRKFLVNTNLRSTISHRESQLPVQVSQLATFLSSRDVLKFPPAEKFPNIHFASDADPDLDFWEGSFSGGYGGVEAGDSGSPAFRVTARRSDDNNYINNLLSIDCLEGIVAREQWHNPLGIHSTSDTIVGLHSNPIIQKLVDPNRWVEVYPQDRRTFIRVTNYGDGTERTIPFDSRSSDALDSERGRTRLELAKSIYLPRWYLGGNVSRSAIPLTVSYRTKNLKISEFDQCLSEMQRMFIAARVPNNSMFRCSRVAVTRGVLLHAVEGISSEGQDGRSRLIWENPLMELR